MERSQTSQGPETWQRRGDPWVSLLPPLYPRQGPVETSNQELPTGTDKRKSFKKSWIPLVEGPEKWWQNNRKLFWQHRHYSNQPTEKKHVSLCGWDLPSPTGRSSWCSNFPAGVLMGLSRELSFYPCARKQAVLWFPRHRVVSADPAVSWASTPTG